MGEITKEIKEGTLLRAKGTKKLYLFLGEAKPQDYVKFGLERMPPTWKFDYPPDYLLCDLGQTEFILQTIEQIDLYFDVAT